MTPRGILHALIFFLGVFSVFALPKRERRVSTTTPIPSSFKDCTHDSDCDPDECCVMSPNRYSIPMCTKYKEKNENCIPIPRTMANLTLGYPDGSQIHLREVHYVLCPCKQGLTCNISDGICDRANENNNEVFDLVQ